MNDQLFHRASSLEDYEHCPRLYRRELRYPGVRVKLVAALYESLAAG